MNNTTLFTADRTTHLKVVVVALAASTTIAVFGIGLRGTPVGSGLSGPGYGVAQTNLMNQFASAVDQ